MGLLDGIAGKVFESLGLGGQGNENLLNAVVSMLGNKESGGLSGLVEAFQQKGLGDLMSSWISTGKNLPLSADQLRSGIGADRLRSLAEQAGMSEESASSQLTDLLPGLVDKLTPEGKLPDSNFLEKGLEMLRGKI
ncbi:MAG TPA: YidB family protein [Thermodesulfovibrionales bacterium]|nr:YidB family protein [Thermodesulfovibrionales bacterium]